jgi:hypothetical protein
MEKTMTRSIGLSAAVLFILALVWSPSLSAKTDGTFVQTEVQSAALLNAATSAFPPQALNIWTNSNYAIDDDGYKHDDKDKDWDKDGDGDKDDHDKGDHDHHKYHHEPTPEPSTLLSFGAAILIGGGVLYSRRLRRNK